MFGKTRHIHLVAIGGIGMSGIAEVLLSLGFSVSGSDLRDNANIARLRRQGAVVHIGHDPAHVEGADVVVRSSAVTEANCEVDAARRARIPVIRRAEMLAEIMRLKQGISIAGSHGKTTTTSLVASVLRAGGLDPTVIVGGVVRAAGSNAILGKGEHLVAEADESDGTFLHLTPTIAVVTNVDHEHVDFYPDLESVREAFRRFVQQVPFYGACVLCLDDPEARALIPHIDRRLVTYGLDPAADLRCDPGTIDAVPEGQEAVIWEGDRELGVLRLGLRGLHNLRNALAAVAVGRLLELPFAAIARGLAGNLTVGRRCEFHGEHGGVLVLDDYGHHPREIAATLEVARTYGRPVWVMFQPHRYTRTEMFAREFADVLAGADRVALLPVYAASEPAREGIDSNLIAEPLEALRPGSCRLLEDLDAAAAWVSHDVPAGCLLLTLGAGDIGRLVPDVVALLDRRERS